MLVTTARELARFGIYYNKSAAQWLFCNKVLTKGQSFSCRARQVALRVCQENHDHGDFCLLVEDGNLLTLWRQTGSIQPAHASSAPVPPSLVYGLSNDCSIVG